MLAHPLKPAVKMPLPDGYPQGTLFGRNTTGGAILVNPQRPLNQLGGYVDLSAGNYGLNRVQAALNVPVVDEKLLFRFAIDSNHREGFTQDLQTNDRLDGIHYRDFRVSVIARPFDDLENYLVYDQDDSNTHGGGMVLTALASGSPITEIAPGISSYYTTQQARGVRTVQYDTGADFDIIRTNALTDALTYAITDALSIKGIYGYRQFVQNFTTETDATPYPLIQENPSPHGEPSSGVTGAPGAYIQQSGELQVQGKSFDNLMPWTVGTYYEHVAPYSTNEVDHIVEFYSSYLDQALRYDTSRAVYGQASYHLNSILPGLTVTGGLRETKDHRKLFSGIVTNGVCTQIDADADCLRRQQADFQALTYTANLEYQLDTETLFYLATRKGYKSGGFNASVPTGLPSAFQPETVRDGEIGLKSDVKIGSMSARVNADYYYSKFQDIQLSHTLLAPGGNVVTETSNVADATIQGIEIEGTLIPVQGLELSCFYAFIHAQYDTPSYRGTPFYNVPSSKAGITAKYDFPIGPVGIISPGASFTYQSSTHVSNTPDAFDIQGGYGVLDTHLDWRGVFGSKIDLSAYVTNVTNKIYMVYEIDLYKALGFNDALFGAPRMYGVRVHYSF
jgi:iron complex outermembrane recepter protein